MFIRDESGEGLARGRFTRRAAVVTLGQALGFSILGWRLYQLQVMEDSRFAPLADSNRITMYALPPIRGRIYDRAGRVLADNIEGFRLTITPSLAGNVAAVIETVAKVVPIDEDARARIVVRAKRQNPNIPIVVAEALDFEQIAKISILAPQLPGIETLLVGQRQYFHGGAMGHMVGHVGSVERFALDDDPILRLPGMRIGKIGVEYGMEGELRGTGGFVKREIDARGRVVRDLERRERERGGDVVLTVDTELQAKVLSIMSQTRRGAAVALDITSGEVCAMATWPTADVSQLGEGVSHAKWAQLADRDGDPLFDRTIRGLYPPGSTFKMVTALAALEGGFITPDERINCEGTYSYVDQKYRCWNRSGHGPCNLHRAIKESCDVYFYEISRRMGISKIAEMAERLGLGHAFEEAGIAFQKSGVIPDPSWKLGRFGKRWYGGETLIAGIGQGYVSTTPLQLAVMTARLATGRNVTPHIVRGLGQKDAFEPIGLDPAHLSAIQRAMVAVVEERGGTGKQAQIPGVDVAGKTGTSQVSRLSAMRTRKILPWKHRDHALFVGYVPAEAPRFAVSVVVEHGGSGGKTAAPIAQKIMKTLLEHETVAQPGFEMPGPAARKMDG